MSDQSKGRMLLSHNFELKNNELPALNREEFAQLFITGLQEYPNIACSLIENPHWIVEIIFPSEEFSAPDIGKMCGDILVETRKSQQAVSELTTDTLILGGKKNTPATSTSATSLQPGEWGVDVVETAEANGFLTAINWEALTANKTSDRVFKFELLGN